MRRGTRAIDLKGLLARARTGRLPRSLPVVVAVLALGVAALELGILSTSDESSATDESEPRLDASVAAQGRRNRANQRRETPPRETAQASPPSQDEREETATEEEALPERVLKENARLRRDLGHLKAIEKEQARVRRALSVASASYDGPLRLGPGGLAFPVGGPVVSPFGQRWGRLHAGIDIASPAGTVIRAAADGGVVIAGPTGGYGNYVCLQHTARFTTCYAHLSRFLTERGAVLRQGDPVGLVGCTGHCFGDHLHFETRVDGSPVNPMAYF